MRHTGRKRTAAYRPTPIASPAHSPPRPNRSRLEPGSAINGAAAHSAAAGRADAETAAATEVLLLPGGTFVRSGAAADHAVQRNQQLAIAIRQRIETRLIGRIRNLAVRILGKTVVLEGECSTYYTKQLAQHAALGVLEDEQLENAISVAVPR